MEKNTEINIKALIKDGLSEKSIVRRLTQNGYTETEAQEEYLIAFEAIQDAYTIKYRFLWMAILLVIAGLCFLIVPMSVSGKSPVFIGILAGLLLTFGILQTIEVFDSFSTFWQTITSSDYHRKPKIPIVLVFFIPVVFSIGMVIYYKWEVRHELDANGVNAWASITEVERLTPVDDSNNVNGPVSHRIEIRFEPKGSEESIFEYLYVSEDQFRNAHLGGTIAIRYSERYPQFFEINLESLDNESPSRNMEIIEDDGHM